MDKLPPSSATGQAHEARWYTNTFSGNNALLQSNSSGQEEGGSLYIAGTPKKECLPTSCGPRKP